MAYLLFTYLNNENNNSEESVKIIIINLLLIFVIPGLGYSQTDLEITGFVDNGLTVPLEINLKKILTDNISFHAQIENMVYDAQVNQSYIQHRGRICDWFYSPVRFKILDAPFMYQNPHSLLLNEISLYSSGHPIINYINRFTGLSLRIKTINKYSDNI